MNRIKSIFISPRIYYHALYWIINVLLFTLIFWSKNEYKGFLQIFHENAAFLPGGMIFTYFSVSYLIPRFFFNNRITLYITLQLLVLLLYPLLSNFVSTYYVAPLIHGKDLHYSAFNGFLSILLILVFDIVPLAGVKVLNKFRKDALAKQKSDHEKTEAELKLREAELKLLKTQIQPHFLFNTLNNIYSLSLEKSDKTSDLLLRLADMLSYIIYDCNSERVSLLKEMDFIRSLIELHRVRYHNCDITLRINGDLERLQIAPMILNTFIDNAFRHGAEKDSTSPWIKISITFKDGWLFFTIINSVKMYGSKSERSQGIGISNVRKRLSLIYPERHELIIKESGSRFLVILKIELDKYE